MNRSETVRTGTRRSRAALPTTLVVATLAGVLGCQSPQSASTPPPSSSASPGTGRPALGEDGSVPDDVTVFDDGIPAVANLDPGLLTALRRAATDASDDDVGFVVNSGWRSPEYQEKLLRAAVSKYGSQEEAARWVATAETSPHVSGDAVDIGPSDAAEWLSEHGAEYGLCPIYRNEPWHYELRPEATGQGCPAMYADPTEDPRMRQR
ncbi:M15 family metallopeptidase [Streptomyces sp. NPDC003635]